MEARNIYIFLSFIVSFWILSSAVDTIHADQPLTDGKTIISSGGKFELGFFSPGTSKNRHVGIWFNKVSTQTVVWVANRDRPINDTRGMLNFTRQGILTLLNGSGHVVWSSNATRPAQNPIAQLLDSGNLVVRDATENYLWQSFDYPTDTAVPGMKFGVDLKTGFRRSVWSWKSTNDPSKGEFSWLFDPHGFPQPFVMNGSIARFRSGPWIGRGFANAPSQLPSPGYNYTFVSDPADNCDIYGQCHAYGFCNSGNTPICRCLEKFVPENPTEWAKGNWSRGCVRKIPLDCQKEVKFLKYSGIKLPDTRFSLYSRGMTVNACEELCLRNCSCVAYGICPEITGTNEGCLIWFDELIDMREFGASGQDIYIKLDSSEIGGNSSREKLKKLRISLPLAAASLLSVLCLILYIRKKKKDQNQQHFIDGGEPAVLLL